MSDLFGVHERELTIVRRRRDIKYEAELPVNACFIYMRKPDEELVRFDAFYVALEP